MSGCMLLAPLPDLLWPCALFQGTRVRHDHGWMDQLQELYRPAVFMKLWSYSLKHIFIPNSVCVHKLMEGYGRVRVLSVAKYY